jgi:hypothetical protein
MSNCFEMRCPKCGSEDHIEIFATVCVRLTADGTDADAPADGNHYWDDDSEARCDACNCVGTVKVFQASDGATKPQPKPDDKALMIAAPGRWEDITHSAHGGFLLKINGWWNVAKPRDKALMVAAPEILEILTEQTDAAQAVIDNWSSGDLAAAVNALEGLIEPARAVLAGIKSATE